MAQNVKNLAYVTAVMVIPLGFRDQLAFIRLAMLLLIWLNGYIYMKFMGVLSAYAKVTISNILLMCTFGVSIYKVLSFLFLMKIMTIVR